MIILISILFAVFQACIATNYTYIAAFYTPVGTDETLGTISLKFYGHENLWELLAGINKVERPYSLPFDNLTKDTPVHSKIKIPPATLCTRFMNSTCLQIVEYISEQNERWRNNETVAEIIRNKLSMDPSSQFDWATTIENYAPSSTSDGRILQLETLELGLFVWDMFSMFLENTELGRVALVKSSFTIQIINKTPDILTNFTVLGQGEQTNSIVEKISLFARPGESGYVFTTCGSQNCPLNDSLLSGGSSGVVSFQADDNRDFRFLVSWNDNVGHDSQTYADLKMKVASLDSDYVSLFTSESDICNSPGYWRTKRLNYQYSAKSFVSGLPGERIATIILYEDWVEGADPRVIASDTFYTIWNHQKSQALTAAVNSTNSSDPFEVYQYANLGDSSQEWRFRLVYLPDTEEQGYAIVNEKLLLLLTATSDGTLEIQKYNDDDLRAQLWLITKLSDGNYQIQNLKYKTFLSSEDQTDNNDLWTLKETVSSSALSERFFLNFIEIDFPETTFEDNYYHMIAPETAPQMGVTAISSPVSVQLQAQNTTNKQQFWLIKNVTQPNTNTIGFIIMNHGLNLVLAINDNNTLIASPLISTTDAASLSQLWDVQLREGSIYSSSSYQIRNLKYTDYYLTTDAIPTGGNLFVTTAPESGFLLTRSDVKGYTPFINNIPYHISTFKTTTQYVMDTFSTNLIYGWSVTGQLKQKWKLYNATKTDGTSRPNAFYVQSMYNLSTTALTYLTYNTASGTPTSATGNFAQQDQQSWTVLADPNYYGLVYTIRTYVNANLYLTAPASKTNSAVFTLQASSVRPDDQRFRILISDETFFT